MKQKITFILLGLLCLFSTNVSASLSKGDLAVIGMNGDVDPSSTSRSFAVVALNTIAANETIYITDRGWINGSPGNFTINTTLDGTIQWTTSSSIPAGTVIIFKLNMSSGSKTVSAAKGDGSAIPGADLSISGWINAVVTSLPWNNASGDQLLIYQGTESNPSFIYAFNNVRTTGTNNSSGGWFVNPTSVTGSPNTATTSIIYSELPSQLASSIYAVGFVTNSSTNTRYPNVRYVPNISSGTQANWLANITDTGNWASNSAGNPFNFALGFGSSNLTSFDLGSAVAVPSVTTTAATGVGSLKATLGGEVTADGGASVTERGIVWATTANPTTADTTITNGTGTGSFSAIIPSLPAGTLVHFRAYAINSAGTGYGSDLTFTTNAALSASSGQTNVSCFGGSNGTATVNPSGGVSPYSYVWSPAGGTAATASGLTSGSYTCTITDSESTQISKNFTITQPPALSVTPNLQTNVACFGGSNGAAAINTPTGGTPGYTYDWTPGTPTGDGTVSVTGLTAGTWTCTVTDANSCTASQSFTVTQPTAISMTLASKTNIACNGGSNGSIVINTPTGGAGGYTYDWTPGTPTGDGTTSVTGLTAGTWTCTVTDANSCTKTQSFTVTQPPALSVTAASQTNVACFGGSNGSIVINTPTGGTPGYTYDWTPGTPTGDGTTSITGLTAGTWTCTVTDANGCTKTQSFTVTQSPALSVTAAAQTNVACFGGSNGAAAINTSTGGAGGYTYDWTPGTPTGDGTTSVTGLTAGTWTCTVTDANSCTKTQSFTVTQPPALSVTAASQTNVACFGGSNGVAIINTPTGGAGGYTYDWTPGTPTGDGTTSVTGLTAGTWTCTVSDANGCTASQSFTVTQPPALSVTAAAQTNVACFGGSNGAAAINTPTGGAGGYTYDWTPGTPTGDGTTSITGLTAGTWTCTVTDANGCTKTQSFTVTQPPALSVTAASQTNVACFGGSNGAAAINTPTGGTPGYTYNWTPGTPTGDGTTSVTGLTAGTWTCTVTDANSCTKTQSFTVTQPPSISVTAASQTNISCFGGSNGAVAINTPTGGAGGYTYDWTPGTPTGDGTTSVTGLTAGTWTCTVSDANGCTASQSFTVTQSPDLSVTPSSQTNVACFGGSNGAAAINTPTGGAGGYTYDWTPGTPTGDGTTSVTGLTAGTWTCTVTDANGCTRAQNFTVTQPPVLSVTPASQTNVACNGGSNGAATINTPIGGTPGYTYDWTPGTPTGDGTTSVTGLTAGTWTCTVNDANGCTRAQSFTVTQPPVLSVTAASQTNVACFGGSNGAAAINLPTGGTPGYTYDWTPGTPTGDGTTSVTGLTAGTWTCTVTDANGCTATRTFTITQPTAISTASGSQTNISCNGGSNGTASVTPIGGTPSYTYSWSPSGGTAATATGLSAGTYTVTVTDANGCTATRTFTITQPTAISTASGSQTNVSCNGGSNGTASVTPTGATPSYTYSWSPSGGTAATATGLSAGTYTVTVTDANTCQATRTFTVTQPTAISTASGSQTNVSCNGGSNGTASVTPTGGTPSYTYSWSPSGGTAATATGLSAGTYTVTVTDANTCQATRTFTVTEPTAISTASGSQTNISCNGGSNGTASVTPTGGTPSYTYSWSPSGGTAATATGLSAGTYTVTVTDANSCTATRTFTITQPTAISTASGSQTNVSCNGGSNGTASVTPTGGTPSYTYSWSPSGGTAATATGLSAGTYTVTVTDANGCTATRTFTITQPTAISTASGSQTNVSCNGGSNGTASVTPTGGTPSYTYSWSPSGGTAATASGLSAGTYTVTVTDNNGCQATRTFTVTEPTAISTASGSQTNVSCFGGSNGTASVTPTGGTASYTYSWSPSGGTAATATGLAAGTYTVTVTDANGCTATRTFTITEPTAISTASGSQTNVSCFGGSNGTASVTPTGGTASYTYSWSPYGGTAATATGLSAGTYTVTVTDANTCQATRTFTITQPTAISTASGSQTNVSCFGGSNGTASVAPTGGTPSYTYFWSPSGGTAATATGLSAGTYTVTVTDNNGCTATRTFTVTEPTAISTASGSQTNVSCFGGSNGTASVTPTGGTASYTYSWSPSGGTAATATGLSAGTYTVTVTDNNGCQALRTFTVTEPAAIDATVTLVGTTLTSNQSGANYQWYNCADNSPVGSNTNTFTPTESGDYKVDITIGTCIVTSVCTTVTTLGNGNFESDAVLLIYPNPSQGIINIKSDSDGDFQVVNQIGQVIKTFKVELNIVNTIDLQNLSDSMYFIKEVNHSKAYKIIIKK